MTEKDDARLAKAEAKAAKARAKALRPWYRKKRFILPLALVALVVVAAVAGGGGDDGTDTAASGGPRTLSGNTENPPADDVDIAECAADDLGQLSAQVRITNNSSKASNYIVTVAFESPDGAEQLDTALVTADGLEPGQSTTQEAITFTDAPGDFTCRITEVDRFAAAGS